MSEKPRQPIVGGMKAELLLSSPLLKWYLTHGMKVTKIQTGGISTPALFPTIHDH